MLNKTSIHALLDKKKIYAGYTLNKLVTYFGISKADLLECEEWTNDSITSYLILEDKFDFYYQLYSAHIDRKQLNLDVLMNEHKFAKTMILEEFLIGEAKLMPMQFDSYLFCMHVGAMIWVMYRSDVADESDVKAGMFVSTPNDGSFIITRIENYLQAKHPKQQVD